jgi:serine/threonine protein kinase
MELFAEDATSYRVKLLPSSASTWLKYIVFRTQACAFALAYSVFTQDNMSSEPRELLRVLREISILRLLDHPNIIKIIDVFPPIYSANLLLEQLYIVFEFAGESLHSFLASSHTHVSLFTESDAASIMRQMLAATGYLHRCRVIHRDLKPENVLVQRAHDGTLVVKLGDFGLCREFFEFEGPERGAVSIFQRSLPRTQSGSTRHTGDGTALVDDEISVEHQNVMQMAANSVGVDIAADDSEIFDGDDMFAHPLVRKQSAQTVTPQYRAPEIYMSDGYYDQAIDVWSLGCIFYDMLFIMQQNRRHSQLLASGQLRVPQTLAHRELVGIAF